MKIRRMTATFGRLDRAELRLEDGLNLLELPNEGGKSTWCAFLLAMLYGIDTSRRAAKGTIPRLLPSRKRLTASRPASSICWKRSPA